MKSQTVLIVDDNPTNLDVLDNTVTMLVERSNEIVYSFMLPTLKLFDDSIHVTPFQSNASTSTNCCCEPPILLRFSTR